MTSETESFERLLRERGGFQVSTTTRILPPRQKVSGPRTGGHLSGAARTAGDRWYFNAVPLRTFIQSKIEERFAELPREEKYLKRKAALLNEAKSMLNEHRNQIFEAVLPLFDVYTRSGDTLLAEGDALPEADTHARDYFVRNVFYMLAKTYSDWLPEFCSPEQLETADTTLQRIAQTQREKLERELRNFSFGFRRVVTPR